MNISAEFQLYPPNSLSEEMTFYICFRKFSLSVAMATNQFSCHDSQLNSAVWTKFIGLVEDYSWNNSVKLLSKYLQ